MGKIIWIASYPKSGNTWLRLFLEQLVIGDAEVNPNTVQSFAPNENNGVFYQPFFRTPLRDVSDEALAMARPDVQRSVAERTPGFIFLKTHNLRGLHHGTPTINDQVTAAAVYVVRNPLDVVVSYAEFRQWSIDQAIEMILAKGRVLPRATGGSYMIGGSWAENVASWTKVPDPRTIVLRYEDLLAAPREEFGKMVRFLEIPADAHRIAAAVDATSFTSLSKAEDRHGFNERPTETKRFFRSGTQGEWRERLSVRQVQRVVDECGDMMRRNGYLP